MEVRDGAFKGYTLHPPNVYVNPNPKNLPSFRKRILPTYLLNGDSGRGETPQDSSL